MYGVLAVGFKRVPRGAESGQLIKLVRLCLLVFAQHKVILVSFIGQVLSPLI